MELAGDNKYIGRITELTSGFGEFVATVKPNIDDNEKDRIVTAMEDFVKSLQIPGSSSSPGSNLDSVSASVSMPDATIFGDYDKFTGGLVEGQEGGSSGCGRHALNNLFGAKYFTAYKDKESYTIDEIKEAVEKLSTDNPLDLQRLCGYLYDHPFSGIESVNESDEEAIDDLLCPDNENYNATVLVAALRFFGYNLQIENLGQLSRTINQPDTFGILINTGGHWITVRKYEGKIYKLDSLIQEAVEFSDIDTIRTKSIIVVKEFDEVYRKRYIGVEKMHNALRGIKKKAQGKDFIMHWVHSLQNLFPDNVQLLYESTIETIDEDKSELILEKLKQLEDAMDPYVVKPNATVEDLEQASKDSIQFNKDLLGLLGINGSPAGVDVVGERGDESAKLEKLYNSIAELEAKIGDLEQAKVKSKVKLEVVEEGEVEPLSGIKVSDTFQAEDLSQPDGEDALAQDKSSVDENRVKEIEMIRMDNASDIGANPSSGKSGAPRRGALPKGRSRIFNDTAASLANKSTGPNSVSFENSLRKGFGGNTRRRNRKTRHFQTLKNKKQ
jgi:hypothetical protein